MFKQKCIETIVLNINWKSKCEKTVPHLEIILIIIIIYPMTYHKQTHLKMEHGNETVVKWMSWVMCRVHNSQYRWKENELAIFINQFYPYMHGCNYTLYNSHYISVICLKMLLCYMYTITVKIKIDVHFRATQMRTVSGNPFNILLRSIIINMSSTC